MKIQRKLLLSTVLICLSVSVIANPSENKDSVDVSVINNTESDYRNVLFLKLNKNKGYHKQYFENENTYALLEKRVSYFSINLGFKSSDIDNKWLEPVAVIDKVYNRNFSTNISAGYFIDNNVAIGIKAGYSFSDLRLKVNADILDIIINARTYETNNVSTTLSVAGVIKNFIPLDKGQRLFLVSETGLVYSRTHSLAKNLYDNGVEIHKVEQEKTSIGLGISPGFMYFMTRGFAFEFAMNPVIAYYETVKIKNNQYEAGSVSNYGLSFKFMPFNIQFGFAYYFGLNYFKNKEYIMGL